MGIITKQEWADYAEAFAFLGNSLLRPMTQTSPVGVDPNFWAEFPTFDNSQIRESAEACAHYAQEALKLSGQKAIERTAVEYTRLFVGPPSPAAPPWETMYRNDGATVGFGEATFQMRSRLREAGLKLCNDNHQYEDHIGIELLLLSELCRRQAELTIADDLREGTASLGVFIDEHPARWIGAYRKRVRQEAPNGYYALLASLAESVLADLQNKIAAEA